MMSPVQSGSGHILNIYMFVQSEEVMHLYMSVLDETMEFGFLTLRLV